MVVFTPRLPLKRSWTHPLATQTRMPTIGQSNGVTSTTAQYLHRTGTYLPASWNDVPFLESPWYRTAMGNHLRRIDAFLEASVKIAPGAMVCNECELRGDITIGSMTVIHPRASIIAEAGPIIIGDCNIIEEQARIINRGPPGDAAPTSTPVMIIGANNVFEVDCTSEAQKIGDNNVLESKCLYNLCVGSERKMFR
ncbi:Dynactin subunit 6 [Cryptotermes secundus]|uniref:Dynactin subunit 6 n=1 Tax=Cryptotermes secundus TaxID=105785 RepID=A0A2J7Q5C4_9NEOP|nr:Dynactin subunit 6 [Cryptotermes secundus]